MSLLSSQFDVLRGWPDGGAEEEDFAWESGALVQAGSFVLVRSDGGISVPGAGDHPIPVEGSNTPDSFWVCIEGNGPYDYDVLQTGKVTCLKANLIEIQTDQFVTAAYTPGALLTVSDGQAATSNMPVGTNGQLTLRSTNYEQVVGVVLSYNAAAGLLVATLNSK